MNHHKKAVIDFVHRRTRNMIFPLLLPLRKAYLRLVPAESFAVLPLETVSDNAKANYSNSASIVRI